MASSSKNKSKKFAQDFERLRKQVDIGVVEFKLNFERYVSWLQSDDRNVTAKHERDIKSELKKLQRYRDQIKKWEQTQAHETALLAEYRRKIECEMERFRELEKETKCKAYSKKGLERSVAEKDKDKTVEWIRECLGELREMIERCEAEKLYISGGRGKKRNEHHRIAPLLEEISHHRFHVSGLEKLLRMLDNGEIEAKQVDEVREDVRWHIDEYESEEYMFDDTLYEHFNLQLLDLAPSTAEHSLKADDGVPTNWDDDEEVALMAGDGSQAREKVEDSTGCKDKEASEEDKKDSGIVSPSTTDCDEFPSASAETGPGCDCRPAEAAALDDEAKSTSLEATETYCRKRHQREQKELVVDPQEENKVDSQEEMAVDAQEEDSVESQEEESVQPDLNLASLLPSRFTSPYSREEERQLRMADASFRTHHTPPLPTLVTPSYWPQKHRVFSLSEVKDRLNDECLMHIFYHNPHTAAQHRVILVLHHRNYFYHPSLGMWFKAASRPRPVPGRPGKVVADWKFYDFAGNKLVSKSAYEIDSELLDLHAIGRRLNADIATCTPYFH